MRGFLSEKMRAYAAELPGAIMLSLLTAISVVVLILILSAILGGEQRALLEQSVFNGEEVVDHAIVARCEMAHVEDLLRFVLTESGFEYDKPRINTDGLDCDYIITEPYRTGNDFGLEGPPHGD